MRKKQYPDKVRKPKHKRQKKYKPTLRFVKNTKQAIQDVQPVPVKKTATHVINENISVKYIYEHIPDQHKEVTSVRNVSLLYKHRKKLVSVSRYDDHDGTDFHRHERISGKDIQIPIAIDGGPKQWLAYAVNDFMKNYDKYITNYLHKND